MQLEQEDDDEINKQKEVKELLNKLPIIKGGIESRFIPNFSQETKNLIEGFLKITQDKKLREYALSDPS